MSDKRWGRELAAVGMCLVLVGVGATQQPTVGLRWQQPRTDALVQCLDAKTRAPVVGASVMFSVGGMPVTIRTDGHGVAYCGARSSNLSVFEYGAAPIVFVVSLPGYRSERRERALPAALQRMDTSRTKLVETFVVPLVSSTRAGPNPEVATRPATRRGAPAAMPNGHIDCQRIEVFVGSRPIACVDSTHTYASATYVNGTCSSPIDWSNSRLHNHQHTATWSRDLTASAAAQIAAVAAAKVEWKNYGSKSARRAVTTRVLAQGTLGKNAQPGMCGNTCMNAIQRLVITQVKRRCCVRANGFGCLRWGPWKNEGAARGTRVVTGFCTTEARLFPCNQRPKSWPLCSK